MGSDSTLLRGREEATGALHETTASPWGLCRLPGPSSGGRRETSPQVPALLQKQAKPKYQDCAQRPTWSEDKARRKGDISMKVRNIRPVLEVGAEEGDEDTQQEERNQVEAKPWGGSLRLSLR